MADHVEQDFFEDAAATLAKPEALRSSLLTRNSRNIGARALTRPLAAQEPMPAAGDVDMNEPIVWTEELKGAYLTDDTAGDYMRQAGKIPLLNSEQETELSKKIETGLYAEQLLRGNEELDERVTTDASEQELRQLVRDGEEAKQRMIEANLRLVISNARRFVRPGVQLSDLASEGNFGLMHAIKKFDYTKGYKFSTYATWWINQALHRSLGNLSGAISLPVRQHEALGKMDRIARTFAEEHGRQPTTNELAEAADMLPQQITHLQQLPRHTMSLDETIPGHDNESGGITYGDRIVASTNDIDEALNERSMSEAIQRALQGLDPRAAYMVRMRYGLLDGKEYTLGEIGSRYGLTRERARQIIKNAERCILTSFAEEGLSDIFRES